jgi:hypothetical protein
VPPNGAGERCSVRYNFGTPQTDYKMLESFRDTLRRNKTTGSVVIKRQLSSRTKLLIAGAVGAAVIVGANFLYDYGVNMAGFERTLATRVQGELEQDNGRLMDENQQLREALARAERTIQMDQAAYQDLDKSLQGSAQEIVKLREELNFYRNIISPADKKGGLRVQSLDIQATGTNGAYRYKLVLIQALKHERSIFGNVMLEINGSQGGQNTVIKIPGVQVNLKYFQDIEGKFDLPRGFKAYSVKVSVTTAGGGPSIEAVYDWPQV